MKFLPPFSKKDKSFDRWMTTYDDHLASMTLIEENGMVHT